MHPRLDDALHGCLLGTAVGDALGLRYEGLSAGAIARLCPGPLRPIAGGAVSDDTEQTWLLTAAAQRSGGDLDRFRRELRRDLWHDFVARLAALVPPPRAHTVLYHGVLTPRATLRSRVVPTPPPPPPEATLRLTQRPAPVPAPWRTWAQRLARVFGQAGWTCPRRAGPLHLRAIVWPPASFDVLRDLGRSASPARAPPAPALASGTRPARRQAGVRPSLPTRARPGYPDIFVSTGRHDPVPFWGPTKWVARLRERATGGEFLLRILNAGHGGLSSRHGALEERSRGQAWLLDRLGLGGA